MTSRPSGETPRRRALHRNVWVASATSFLTDVSSEMVIHVLPLYLAHVLGVGAPVVGLVEGAAESIASMVKLASGRLSDRWGSRKWLAVGGYGLSAISRPFFLLAGSWGALAAVRWVDRLGKGVRTAPRDALVADSTDEGARGLAFGLHRAADTAGAVVGVAIAIGVVLAVGSGGVLDASTFTWLVVIASVPGFVGVAVLALGARDVRPSIPPPAPRASRPPLRTLGRPFFVFLAITAVFEIGSPANAFVLLRASERGLGTVEILVMVLASNLVYALLSTPAGALSDRIGRRILVGGGWLVYASVFLGLALAEDGWHVGALYIALGLYPALTQSASKALVTDLVPREARATAFGAYAAVAGLLDLPASLLAGLVWEGGLGIPAMGPSAPFALGACTATIAALALAMLRVPARAEPT